MAFNLQLQKTKKITIIGIGNTLYSDEGVGVHILPYLEKALFTYGNVEVIEGITDGIKLLGPIEEADYLIILDAVNAGKVGGSIITLLDEEIPAYFGIKMSIHQIGMQEVINAARIRERLPEKMVLFGIQPYSLELGLELSDVVKNQIPKMVELVTDQVKLWSDENESC